MIKKYLIFTTIYLLTSISITSQEMQDSAKTQNFSVGADLVNTYVWRGLPFSDMPNIQPGITFTNNSESLSIGAWGSYSLSEYYSEIDLFVSYSISNFTISVWDYFNMSQNPKNSYFNYDKDSTTHLFEAMLTFNGSENFPIQLVASTFFYGIDKNAEGDNNYSGYFEVAYPFKWKSNNLKVFLGMTPTEGFYASDIAVTNIGLSNSREIRINDKFSLPVSGSLIFNPNLENIYLILSINISAND